MLLIDREIADKVGRPHFDFARYPHGPYEPAVHENLYALAADGKVVNAPSGPHWVIAATTGALALGSRTANPDRHGQRDPYSHSGRRAKAMAESNPALLSRNAKLMSVAVVVNGTSVPATALIPHAKTEGSLAEFFHDFLAASREQDRASLLFARRALSRPADGDPAG